MSKLLLFLISITAVPNFTPEQSPALGFDGGIPNSVAWGLVR